MKLFTAYNRINLISTVIIFLLASTAFYFLLRYVLVEQVDKNLKIEQHEIQTYTAKYQHLPEIMHVKDQEIRYTPVSGPPQKHFFRTVKPAVTPGHDDDEYRELVFNIFADGQWHEVVVGKSMEGTDDMTESIITITLSTLLLILITSLAINRIMIRRLWKPFYNTLSVMGSFEIGKMQEPVFAATQIDEFTFMNDILRDATARAREEYLSLKEFTENASHELQTPLAIIQSKLDILIQDEQLTEPQSRLLQSAYEALQKMTRLNQSLLLLTKIKNRQYSEQSAVDLPQKLAEKITQCEELAKGKNISFTKDIQGKVTLLMNPLLVDILLNNLFSNAIKYAPAGGTITVRAREGLLEMSNTGHGMALDPQQLFRRFGKPGPAMTGIGLGLAIIKQISDISGITVQYHFTDGAHVFSFTW